MSDNYLANKNKYKIVVYGSALYARSPAMTRSCGDSTQAHAQQADTPALREESWALSNYNKEGARRDAQFH